MSLFVEVESIERGCQVIINIDNIIEIAPLKEGGCALFYSDSAAVGGKMSMKVRDSYEMFKQFAMTTVSSDMIQDRIAKINEKVPADMKQPAKPRKTMNDSFDIPKL
jgi:hypothetical protein